MDRTNEEKGKTREKQHFQSGTNTQEGKEIRRTHDCKSELGWVGRGTESQGASPMRKMRKLKDLYGKKDGYKAYLF